MINEAHKENKVNKALAQVQQYANALNMAHNMVDLEETLVVSMSDFGSTLSIAGHTVSVNPCQFRDSNLSF